MELDSKTIDYLKEEDVKKIVKACGYVHKDVKFEYYLELASDKMLGFLADYWRLKIHVSNDESNSRKVLSFFIKVVSRSNESKANMVKEMNLFQKEVSFYSIIKKKLQLNDLKEWSPELITALDEDALVFEDLAALQFKSRNKFERFDMAHTLQALNTLARFHAASIIHEETNRKSLNQCYSLHDEYNEILEERGYLKTGFWFKQCMEGALEAIRTFSKYNDKETLNNVERNWENIWFSAMDIADYSTKYRNVICHRDLWNNNIMFHYKQVGDGLEPDDCVMVDFQAIRCQPPTGDVMLLLYCNLDPKFRKNNQNLFLNYYYKELSENLANHGIAINEIISKKDFLTSAEEQKKWGLIACACLIPLFWVDDELTTKTFSDPEQYDTILKKNKADFIKEMMHTNSDYKNNVLGIFEEIIETYCIADRA